MPTSVSVVIPVRDDAPALDLCLRLLSRQTRPPLEVVVVDNGSVDDSAAVAARHGARVVVEPAPGIPAAASAGYDAARGEVLARCDADSVPPVDWLARITAQFDAQEDLQALTGSGDFYGVPRWRAVTQGRLYLWCYDVTMHAALGHHPLWGSNMAVRRTAWQEARGRVHRDDPEIHDDVDLSFALGPDVRLRRDPRLRVGVSGRSLRGGAAGRRRFGRAFRTLELGWRAAPPWTRWAVRLASRPGSRPL